MNNSPSARNSKEGYEQKKQQLIKNMLLNLKNKAAGEAIAIQKSSSNLFRNRNQVQTHKIDVKNFNKVILVDEKNPEKIAEVEGMTTYEELVRQTLKHGLMPAVVPQLKSITIGGATSGIGIEASSFKYGFVHETVQETEILIGNGSVVTCSPNDASSDLFFSFPNSYGTFGYALKLKIKLIPVKKYVKINHIRYGDSKKFFADLSKYCLENRENGKDRQNGDEKSKEKLEINFIDGVVFSPNEMYITVGSFTDEAPFTSNYKYMKIYYKSLQKKSEDYLTTEDFIWRWDADWFWCSKIFHMQNPLLRLLFGKFMLNSIAYWKVKKFFEKSKILSAMERIQNAKNEAVIQDVEIPIENCEKFLDFFNKQIGIKPIWICPVMSYDKTTTYDLYRLQPEKLYVNFGFWDAVKTVHESGHYNRLVEEKVEELGGKKSLYSDSYYSYEKFWQLYNKPKYDQLKKKYDPLRTFRDLYEKTVKAK